MFHLMIKVLVNLHLWMEKIRSRYLYYFLSTSTETQAIRRILVFLVWMLSFSILAFEYLSVQGSWLFGWCQLLSVYSVKMVFVLTAKENMVTQCGGKMVWWKSFDAPSLFLLFWSFILGEMHAEETIIFRLIYLTTQCFEIFSCAHNRQETTIHICSIIDADRF